MVAISRRPGKLRWLQWIEKKLKLKYKYTALPGEDYIRILELLPGQGNEVISCRLHTRAAAEVHDTYKAISYVWGNPNETVVVFCNNRIVRVTVNLADALRAIRNPQKSKLVWADAICINQEDDIEKSHQVKRMGKVYKDAKAVLVWLGKDSEGIAEDCFALIQETNRYLDIQFTIYGGWEEVPVITQQSPICLDRSRWKQVDQMVNMLWFSRLWVIQETGLAKRCELRWGEQKMNFAELCELSQWIDCRSDLSRLFKVSGMGRLVRSFYRQCTYDNVKSWTANKPFIQWTKQWMNSRENLFLEVLHLGREMEASVDVDRVYAFLGNPLANKRCESGLGWELMVEPDYSKSMQDVYFKTACALFSHPREAPYVLAFVQHHSQDCVEGMTLGIEGTDNDFPSWVPRWDKFSRQYSMSLPNYWYYAGGESKDTVKFNACVQRDKSLLLPAIIFDRLIWTSDTINTDSLALNPDPWDNHVRASGQPLIDSLFAQVQQASRNPSLHPNPTSPLADTSSFEDAFSMTMVRSYPADSKYYQKYWGINDSAHRLNFAAYRLAARDRAAFSSEQHQHHAAPPGNPYLISGKLDFLHGRCFAITESGRFGLVPWIARPDDVCCVCLGMKAPLVLRPRKDGSYGLVGDSYIHDVMRGEIMEQHQQGKVKLEDIIII
jgi:Heterokaryon incompatibility protein (HET)